MLTGLFIAAQQSYPWFQIKLNKTVNMMGVEMTHPDLTSLSVFFSKYIQFRAGPNSAPIPQGSEATGMQKYEYKITFVSGILIRPYYCHF